jgi:hypothetical protein
MAEETTTEETTQEETTITEQTTTETTGDESVEQASLIGDPVVKEPVVEGEWNREFINEKGDIDKDKLKVFVDKRNKEYADTKKQKDDLHRTLSAKGQVPKKLEDYYEKYGNEKYSEKKNDPMVKEAMHALAVTFEEQGISTKDGDKIYDRMFDIFEKTGQLDLRTDNERIIEHNKWVDSEKKKLGENADQIVMNAVNFVKDVHGINEKAREKVLSLMASKEGGAELINAIFAMSKLSGKGNIPVEAVSVSGIPTDAEFAKELKSTDITEARRKEIYILRAKAGRKGGIINMAGK